MVRPAAGDWVSRFADQVVDEAQRRGGRGPIVCASGLSPSGPIHLGNLREVMTPHLVADEIRRRGLDCRHVISWDDYDRFRKVPAGFDASWAAHIGRPLTSVPAPPGSAASNWAEHFKAPMIAAMAELGIEYEGISQTERYTCGAYRDQILLAVRERHRIDAILGQYRTKGQPAPPEGGYFPYRPYCSACERDLTTITSYDDEATRLDYVCACGHSQSVRLSDHRSGKLVWKVDWPMRWAYEDVIFEPSGVDHTSPGSSVDVGGQIVTQIFGGQQPIGPRYAFVGTSGMAKLSSSRGGVPTPHDALQIMEAPLLRWLYARRRPNQSLTVAFDQEILRLYDEWDAQERRIVEGRAAPADVTAYDRAVRIHRRRLPRTARPVAYRTLVSIVDITTGNDEQILRILRDLDPGHPITALEEVQPRLDAARQWVATQMPAQQRTRLRPEPDTASLAGLDDPARESLRLLLERMDAQWSLPGLTSLVYAVPKHQAGLPPDAAPTPELKAAQRRFFALVYRLLIGRETGPRLPTLLLAAGAARVRRLLSA